MPIIPVTKIKSTPQEFAPFIYENHMTDIFDSTITFEQSLPIFTINQPLTAFSLATLVDQVTPSNGIAFAFRLFIVSNNTGKDFKMEFMEGATETEIFPTIPNGTTNTVFLNNTIQLAITKGDKLHYHLETKDGQNPASGKVVMGYITFNFRPTSS